VGLRVTAPRLAVLAVVRELDHPNVEEVVQAARSRLGSVSTQGVYDVLRAFVGAGLVRRIEPAGSPTRYEGRVGDNHHHLVCRRCGSMADVDCVVGHAPCLEPASDAGFLVDEADVTFWGICSACQRSAPAAGLPG
jgi:Fe2+ or Zn2+ uptake regulation protein